MVVKEFPSHTFNRLRITPAFKALMLGLTVLVSPLAAKAESMPHTIEVQENERAHLTVVNRFEELFGTQKLGGYYFPGDETRAPHMSVTVPGDEHDAKIKVFVTPVPHFIVKKIRHEGENVVSVPILKQKMLDLPPLPDDPGWVKPVMPEGAGN